MYKFKSFNLFIVCLLITAVSGGLLSLNSCNTQQGGTCTYEGLECPNAYEIFKADSLDLQEYADQIDSLYEANDSLQAIINGYEQKDHSKIPASYDFTIYTVDTTEANWQEYAPLVNCIRYE